MAAASPAAPIGTRAVPPSVVYGKAGQGHEFHGHHDAGQVCIDAYGERLIVDLGSPHPMYPADFFGEHRYEYFNASARGHNVPMLGGRETRREATDRAEIVAAEFDDARGGQWTFDLTGLYDGARQVKRTVTHLLPGLVAVLDEVEQEQADEIALHWHTIDRAEPDADGCFTVRAEHAGLAARIVRLDGGELTFTRGEHVYRAPYDKGRLGDPLINRYESYVRVACTERACRLLTLFAVPCARRRSCALEC